MSHKYKVARKQIVFDGASVLLAMAVLAFVVAAQKARADGQTGEKKTLLVGRVLADVAVLTHGAGVGPFSSEFIFDGKEEGHTDSVPVKIVWLYFQWRDVPPASFFDYSIEYELRVVRDPKCDERVDSLSYVHNVTESGEPLPPTYVLRFSRGAPKHVLKPDATLACYTMLAGDYRVLSKRKKP